MTDASSGGNEETSWDVFISHAHEDKETLVRPLAERLRARGLRVWYDSFALTVGDNLRRSIKSGLVESRFGIVVLSPSFLSKEWPQRELEALMAREEEGQKVILPVWHDLDVAQIRRSFPLLANRLAVSSENGLDAVVEAVMEALERSGTPAAVPPTPRTPAAASRRPRSFGGSGLAGVRRLLLPIVVLVALLIAAYLTRESWWPDGAATSAGDTSFSMAVFIHRPGARSELVDAPGSLQLLAPRSFEATFEDGRAELRGLPVEWRARSYRFTLRVPGFELASADETIVLSPDQPVFLALRPEGSGTPGGESSAGDASAGEPEPEPQTPPADPVDNLRVAERFLFDSDPFGVAVSPDGKYVWVARGDSTVSRIRADDGGIENVEVGKDPVSLAVSRDGRWVFALCISGARVDVIDTANLTVERSLAVGGKSLDLALSPDARRLYVTSAGSDLIAVFELERDFRSSTLDYPSPGHIEMSPTRKRAYFTDYGRRDEGRLTAIDTILHRQKWQLDLGAGAEGLAVTPSGSKIYVAVTRRDLVAVVPAEGGAMATVEVGSGPRDLAISPSGRHVLVSSWNDGTVSLIETAGDTVRKVLAVGVEPVGIAFSPDGRNAYVANNGSAELVVLDTAGL